MTDKKDFPFPVPSSVGIAVGTISGGFLGHQAGDCIFKLDEHKSIISSEELNSKIEAGEITSEEALKMQMNSEAESIPAVMASAGGLALTMGAGAIAGYNLGATNPNKSVLVSLGAIGAGYGLSELNQKLDNINNNTEISSNSSIDDSMQGMEVNNIDIT